MKRLGNVLVCLAFLTVAAASAQVGRGPISGGGGGAGVTGLTSCADGTAIADNAVLRGDGATKCQGSTATLTDGGTFTAGGDGTALVPAFKLKGGTAGWFDDWGTGGLAGSFVAGTGFTLYSVSGGAATGRLFIDTSKLQLGNAAQLSFGTIGGASDIGIARGAAGILDITDGGSGAAALHLRPMASPPRTCDGTAEGDFYSDTSHALCWCDGTTWTKLGGAGTCA